MHTCFFGSAFALSRAFLTRSSWCILCCSIFSSRNFNLLSFSFAYNSHRNSVNIFKSTLIILSILCTIQCISPLFMYYTPVYVHPVTSRLENSEDLDQLAYEKPADLNQY